MKLNLKIDARLLTKKTLKTWSKSEGIELFVELVDREDGSLKNRN
jgi:hypothetical protein